MNIILNEVTFTNVCKIGILRIGSTEIFFSKKDILDLIKNKEINKDQDILYNIRISNISDFTINEIIKRSPIFSDLANNS